MLVKCKRNFKSDPFYDPEPCKIVSIKGSMITVERNGQLVVRNSSYMKKYFEPNNTIAKTKPLDFARSLIFNQDKDAERNDSTDKSGCQAGLEAESEQSEVARSVQSNNTSEDYETGSEDLVEESEDEAQSKIVMLDHSEEMLPNNEACKKVKESKRQRRPPDFYGNPVHHTSESHKQKKN